MKKKNIFKLSVSLMLLSFMSLYSQQDQINVGPRGQEEIVTEIINDFEEANRWYGEIYLDYGLIRVEKKQGAPKDLRQANPDKTKFVLGAKVNFFQRSFSEATINPPVEIPINGFVKKMSIWAVGVNAEHKVYAVIKDITGKLFELEFSPNLNYFGWKKLELIIPDNPKETTITQSSPLYKNFYHRRGLTFMGLKIVFNAYQAVGETYFYFDQFEVENDVYLEKIDRAQQAMPPDEREIPVNNW